MGESDDAGFMANWSSQVRKGVLELVIMSALSVREHYGYEMVVHIHTHCGLEVSDGTLYAILARLRAEGFVKHRWEHAATGPARKYYSLTAAGASTLGRMRQVWGEITGAASRAGEAGRADNA